MESRLSPTASSWTSFKDTLLKVLDIIQPKTIFEYGPGESTKIMAVYAPVVLIDSVEHNKAWYEKYKWELPENVYLIYEPVMEIYPNTPGRLDKYDLVFVDGKEREKCLFVAKSRLNQGGVVMLHDAERAAYKDLINTYKYKFYTDSGHTVTLTDDFGTSMRLESLID